MKKEWGILIVAALILIILASYSLWECGLFKVKSPEITDISLVQPRLPENIATIEPIDQDSIGRQYSDISLFLSPIKQTTVAAAIGTITGLIVPHHLLARDLIAETFSTAAKSKYRLIVLLSPDHFEAGRTAVSITERNFSTVFGEIKTASEISRQLKKLPFISEGDFFYREHGLQVELPFIKYYFPTAEVVALTFKPTTSQAELDQIISVLEKNLATDSLIVQSTDFSHYLTPVQALARDTETITTIKNNDPDKILDLNQPDNIDSLAAQYVQARLQKNFFGAQLNILDHKNSQDYTTKIVASSTSYLAATYVKSEITPKHITTKDQGNAEFIFVGDVMLSRYIGELMAKRKDYNFPFALIKPYFVDADLIFGNLESPISRQGKSTGKSYSFRADPLVTRGLKDAGFTVLSVANNHAFDYGRAAFSDTLDNLKSAGIAYTGGGLNFQEAHQGAYQEINGVKTIFLAYTDLLPKSEAASDKQAGVAYLDLKQLAPDIKAAKEKADLVFVSFHWGREYETKHNVRQEEVAKAAIAAGASLIIGHHPHVAQDVGSQNGVTIAYSLGNFIFDQNFSPETRTGLMLKVNIKDKKIAGVEEKTVHFNHYFQPYIED